MIELSTNITDYLSGLYGNEEAGKYFEYIKSKHISYIRFSRFADTEKLYTQLLNYGIKLEKVEEIPDAYKVLEGEEVLGKTLEYNLGLYYIQSLSSMIPPIVLAPDSSDVVMDTCSAPGSKATRMAELMNNQGTLIVNESNLDRIKILVHNIDKTSLVNIGVIRNRAEFLSQIYNNHFDKILVDAPCSALGVLQKKGEVSNWWSLDRVNNITAVQQAILTSAVKMVKVGGEIVYSTCTLTVEENEIIINQVLEKYPVEVIDINIPIKCHEGFTEYQGLKLDPSLKKAWRILPWEVDSEGFFIIKLRKTGDTISVKKPSGKGDYLKLLTHHNIEKYLADLTDHFGIDPSLWEEYKYLVKGSDIFFINKDWNDENLNVFTRIGTQLGMIDKKDKAHLHTFAAQHLAGRITKKIFPLTTGNQLKDYLNGNIIRTGEPMSGQYVIKFNEYILGTAVGVNNGLKSQYPKSSRIHEISCF